jgi:uncharacterized membrane protein
VKFIHKITEHRLFQTVVYLKGVFGIIEAAAGMLLLIAGSRSLARFVEWIFGNELLEDPSDPIGNFFINIANNLSLKMHIFFGIYLLVHGLVNIGIVFALVHKKRWAFPMAGAILILFVIYQAYQLLRSFSMTIMVLTFIDLIILSLLKIEYSRSKR